VTQPLLVLLAVVGLTWLTSGLALVLWGTRTAGTLAALAGLGAVAAAAAGATDRSAAPALLVLSGALLAPLALACFPRPRWQHPLDFLALTVLAGCGVVATLSWRSVDAVSSLGLVSAVTLFAHIWWRIEQSGDRERRSLQWMALFAAAALVVSGLLGFASEDVLTPGCPW